MQKVGVTLIFMAYYTLYIEDKMLYKVVPVLRRQRIALCEILSGRE
jgi:hypothetical protein